MKTIMFIFIWLMRYLCIWMLLLSNETKPFAAVRRDPAGGRSSISIGYQYLTSTPSLRRYVSTWTSSFTLTNTHKQVSLPICLMWMKKCKSWSIILTESTSNTTPCKPNVFNMPRIANFGSAVPPVELLVLLLSGQRMTTVNPVLERKVIIKVS